MKKALVLTAALVLGSSAALADSFSFKARGSIRVGFGTRSPAVIVRDHRGPVPVYTTNRWSNDYRDLHQGELRPMQIPTNLDCRNWDPALERDHDCSVYSTGYTSQPAQYGAWQYLGTRESAVPEGQFITVRDGRAFGQLKLTAEQGNPLITKVVVRFMDASEQVVNLGARMRAGASTRIFLDKSQINQIVIYTANGSHGTYSIAAL